MNLPALWEKIPAPLRTLINVALGAALAGGVGYLVQVVSGDKFDVNLFIAAIATAVGTAVVRAINPADAGYGVGSTTPIEPAAAANVPVPAPTPIATDSSQGTDAGTTPPVV